MSTKQLDQEYKNMISAAARVAFVTAVRRNHDATLAEVVAMAQKEGLGDITVGEAFFDKVEFGSMKALPAATPKKRKAAANASQPEAADTRTQAARESYEAQLLDSMKAEGRWVSAATLRDRVGGTPLQARKALNRLIEQELVKFRGQARATKYKIRKIKRAA